MYTREAGLNFWFAFDEATLWRRTAEVTAAIQSSYGAIRRGPDQLVDLFRELFPDADLNTKFEAAIRPGAAGFLELANIQQRIMGQYFGSREDLRAAFEEFGQGVLFDPKRAHPMYQGHRIHMMDGTPDDWVGYHRWHVFCRAASLSGADSAFWRDISNWVGLAWCVQTEADPAIDEQSNPGLTEARLTDWRTVWTNMPEAATDRLFVTYRSRAPDLESVKTARRTATPNVTLMSVASSATAITFRDVQAILENATVGCRPIHDSRQRFWSRPYSEFMALPPIYGVPLIADPGPNRGERSGLVRALKGVEPFGPGGFPRMPLNMDPVPDDQIAHIERWIDDDCPQ